MQIIVKLDEIITFYKKHLIQASGEDFNAFPDIYHEDQEGNKTESSDPFLMGLKFRFKQVGDKNYWLQPKTFTKEIPKKKV